MAEKLIFDSCVIIDFLKGKPDAIDLDPLLAGNICFISFITKLETLGYPDIPVDEETKIHAFLPKVTMLSTNELIEAETIEVRRKTNLKLPDAIIAATAIILDAAIVTTDPHFFNCQYPALRVMPD
jgi:predicted nucleic acid-binding protein